MDDSPLSIDSNPHAPISVGCLAAARWIIRGAVQGLGIRPLIARLAIELNLTGWVRNDMQGVVVVVEGVPDAIDCFAERLPGELSELIASCDILREAQVATGRTQFQIEASNAAGSLATPVPIDLKICGDCMSEIRSSDNRRFRYPFTTCTRCGPRYSILRMMPYDREHSSMNIFAMCEECSSEYTSPHDRRFHSQSNSCRQCGPRMVFSTAHHSFTSLSSSADEEVFSEAASLLLRGRILALKGLGGYQLLCSALDESAVARLRALKQRRGKPLAVMVASSSAARCIALVSTQEALALESPAGPIVVLQQRTDSPLAQSISMQLNTVGVMLPTTALHAILIDRCSIPLVVTSGNLEGEPLVYRNEEAERQLSAIADAFLHHDREIIHPVDDSVVRCIGGRITTLRAARGLTPMIVDFPCDDSLLAVGGQQKGTLAWSNGHQNVLGPHLGDMESVASRLRFEEHLTAMKRLYRFDPSTVAHDRHPDYFSTRWALDSNRSCIATQHHHAHVVAGMLENGWLEETVLGIAMDGTGLGEDGIIRGGEWLLATVSSYRRVGSLRPFPLSGGEAAIREPMRIGQALIRAAEDDDQPASPMHRSPFDPLTTSVGRLFDGVASIAMGSMRPTYEGELATIWESVCDLDEPYSYRFEWVSTNQKDEPWLELDWRPMIRSLILDCREKVAVGRMATRFHRGLAQAIAAVIDRFAEYRVICSGGVFQNRVLVEMLQETWERNSKSQTGCDAFEAIRRGDSSGRLGWSVRIPPNDGGLSIGQLAIAAAFRAATSESDSTVAERASSCA